MTKLTTLEDRFLGGLFGSVVGDALGVPVEFTSRAARQQDPVTGMREYGTHNQPAGTWSDDTSLALCLAESLTLCGVDLRDQSARFQRWLYDGYWTPHGVVFDIGNATRQALRQLAAGAEPTSAGPRGEYHCGNGSLMRILPLALYLAQADPAARAKIVADASCLTHGHPRCRLSCAMYCEVAGALLRGRDIHEAVASGQNVVRQLLDEQHPEERHAFDRLLSSDLEELPSDQVSSSGYVIHCLEAGLWCALRAGSFADGVLAAVNLGDDTDTTGAVAGGLLGLRFGRDDIPADWIDGLARLGDVESLGSEFLVASQQRWEREGPAQERSSVPASRPQPSLEERFVGCVLGLAVGDALGAHFEGQPTAFMERKYKSARHLIHSPPPGEIWYTDDTQMAIGVAETLVRCGQIESAVLCERFAENYLPQRGYGRGARLVLEAMRAGHDHQYLAETLFPGGSFGNGAAMRVAPVGLMFRDDHSSVWQEAHASSLPTHVHPLGVEGAQVLALAVALASASEELDRQSFFGSLAERCTSDAYSGPLRRAARLENVRDLGLFGNGIEATASVVTAIAAFGLTPDSYGETIGNAILLGGDTDTIAAMAGAISGAYLGVGAIPEGLLAKLEDRKQGKTYIEQLARDLYAAYEASRTPE